MILTSIGIEAAGSRSIAGQHTRRSWTPRDGGV